MFMDIYFVLRSVHLKLYYTLTSEGNRPMSLIHILLFCFFQVMLGIFFSAKSAVLIEDVPFTEEDIRNE